MTAPYPDDGPPSPMDQATDKAESARDNKLVHTAAPAGVCAGAAVDAHKRYTRLRAEAAVWMIRLDAGRVLTDDAALARWCARSSAHRDALASARLNWARATPTMANVQPARHDSDASRATDPSNRPGGTAAPRRVWDKRHHGDSPGLPVRSPPHRRFAEARQRPSLATRLGVGIVFAGAALSIAAMFCFAPDFDTGTGTVRTWTLADGTVMRLDARSAVDLHYSADSRRIVLLHGRAAFTVAHGDPRPFIVDTDDTRVTDIGTAFQVDTPDTAARPTTVIVTQGAIRFANAGVSRTMVAGDIGQAHHDAAPTVNHATLDGLRADTAWQRGRLQFDNCPLASVVAELNRYFPGHHIFVDEALRDQRVSGNFALNDPASALATLVEVLHLRQTTWAGRLIFLGARAGA